MEKEEMQEIFKQLDTKAQDVLLLVAKGMQVASQNKKGE